MRNFDWLVALDLGKAQVVLTHEGRRLLGERVHALRVEVLPALHAALDGPERDGGVDADYQRAANELRRLTWLVDHAATAEDLLGEPAVAELGKAVTVQDGQGAVERFLIVHPVEAPLDDTRISVRSPLAQALLGHQAGEEVEVAAPAGPYRCRIVAVEAPADATAAAPRTVDAAR